MLCDECANASLAPMWRRRDVRCEYCAARAIWLYGQMAIPADDIRKFRREVVRVAVENGLSESRVRELWKDGLLIEPAGKKA